MLVIMKQDASQDCIDNVIAAGLAAGLTSNTFDGSPPMLLLEGTPIHDTREEIAAMPGVVRVADAGSTASPVTNNLRIAAIRPLVPPAILMENLPLPPGSAQLVQRARNEISDIINGTDDRLLVVVGPCSIHDAQAALDYAERLAKVAVRLESELRIVMRVYFEKPRTTVGWKGLINDPYGDNSFAVNEGLHIARKLLLDVLETGLPTGCEFLDPVSPQFIADSVSWAAIGARTTESQVHRNLASGLSMPVGFKNATSGDLQVAIDAMSAAAYHHHFMSVTDQGLAGIVETKGNLDTHVILRGGTTGPNFDANHVRAALENLARAKKHPGLMVDASHGNSNKDYRNQPSVMVAVAEQLAEGETGITGVMMESFIEEGRQDLGGATQLIYGQSVTDSCMGWEMTVPVLDQLADAVRKRRSR